jgi:hypothetical protein
MRRRSFLFVLLCFLGFAAAVQAKEARIIKVLPHFLDGKGRHALSPSLYERDAYQVQLRTNPGQRSGIRFDVQWKGPINWKIAKLRVDVRGAKDNVEKSKTLEQPLGKPNAFSGTWSAVSITGPEYKKFGEVVAWRATLWEGDKQVAEQKSFLW